MNGRLCALADNSKDPLDGMILAWYAPPLNGKNVGFFCWYCGRVWFTYYRHDPLTRNLTLTATVMGADSNKHKDCFPNSFMVVALF